MKKNYEVTAIVDYTICVRISASSKDEAEELFLQGEWCKKDITYEEYDDTQQVTRVDEEV